MEATRAAPGSEEAQASAGVDEVHILWISEGMSCDGDTVSITAIPSLRRYIKIEKM